MVAPRTTTSLSRVKQASEPSSRSLPPSTTSYSSTLQLNIAIQTTQHAMFRPLLNRALPRISTTSRRANSSQRPPPQQPPSSTTPNPHREFYRGGLGRAVFFNFLIATGTFQALYWSWLKLESMEVKREKGEEIKVLEGELKGLIGKGT
ncbi:uncharacterized protein RCC_04161 [Ramularia collo-cygni]|uniref:Uncharacterized protein n=1 Tax=Ramularia collo-cygni TaxID=112498 RepID=A0A2D3V0Y0_9PEZI|nr:uncharacterized protein RCC_04161 [Ramularia collo-cygni]CZT18317.1 uncharacterized protein RCC_04161 [Ramularia collo-cygni]